MCLFLPQKEKVSVSGVTGERKIEKIKPKSDFSFLYL